jgi:hypothetical protein
VWTSVQVDAMQLWKLGEAIVSLFGGVVLSPDQHRAHAEALRSKISSVLFEHEARCLDDDIDRGVVINALVKAIGGDT